MTDFSKFAFDPEAMRDFFEKNDFTKMMGGTNLPKMDPQALFASQQKNMEALVAANKAAATGFQALFAQQMSILEDTMSEARKQVSALDGNVMDAKKAQAQSEIVKAAFEKALANMQSLAETAQKANSDAFEVVSGRVKESMTELQQMVDGLKK